MLKVLSLIPRPVKLETASPTARYRYNIFMLPRRYAATAGPATRCSLRPYTASVMKICFLFYLDKTKQNKAQGLKHERNGELVKFCKMLRHRCSQNYKSKLRKKLKMPSAVLVRLLMKRQTLTMLPAHNRTMSAFHACQTALLLFRAQQLLILYLVAYLSSYHEKAINAL